MYARLDLPHEKIDDMGMIRLRKCSKPCGGKALHVQDTMKIARVTPFRTHPKYKDRQTDNTIYLSVQV